MQKSVQVFWIYLEHIAPFRGKEIDCLRQKCKKGNLGGLLHEAATTLELSFERFEKNCSSRQKKPKRLNHCLSMI